MKSLTNIVLLLTLFSAAPAFARDWTDSTGHYKISGDLIAFNEKAVILKRTNSKLLVSIPPDKLSKADQEYLASKEVHEANQKSLDTVQTWTMASGLKISGKLVEYGRRTMTIQRKRGEVYVNDRPFDNLPVVYQKMVPKIVNHFEKTMYETKDQLNEWLTPRKGKPVQYELDGVMMEMENGDLYGIPFFFFSEADLKILKPGWDHWLGAEEDKEKQQQHAFELQAQAQAYQQDKMVDRQMMQVQLNLEAYRAGLLWEVQLYPGQNFNGQPVIAVVPGINSDQAAAAALMKYPGYTVGGIARAIPINN